METCINLHKCSKEWSDAQGSTARTYGLGRLEGMRNRGESTGIWKATAAPWADSTILSRLRYYRSREGPSSKQEARSQQLTAGWDMRAARPGWCVPQGSRMTRKWLGPRQPPLRRSLTFLLLFSEKLAADVWITLGPKSVTENEKSRLYLYR